MFLRGHKRYLVITIKPFLFLAELEGLLNFNAMNGNVKDHGNYKHGLTEHPLYKIWGAMKNRCKTTKTNGENYHGRGIKVCEEWQKFVPFYEWSIKNGYQKGLTLDRINNNGNYEPGNCRFTNYNVQNSNKRKYQSMPR